MADENSENASHPLDGSSDADSCDIVSATELSNPPELNQTSIELEQGDIIRLMMKKIFISTKKINKLKKNH